MLLEWTEATILQVGLNYKRNKTKQQQKWSIVQSVTVPSSGVEETVVRDVLIRNVKLLFTVSF